MKTKQTKFVDRVAAAFGFSRMIEAVNHRSEERGWVYAQAQDSKVDLSSYDRTRLMALSRKCFYNNAIVRGAVRDKAMYSVGSGIGIRPQAMSGDQAWDDAAEQWWENWARSPEISGRHDMRSLQMLVSEAIDRDGEIFAILTAKTDGAPAVQIVEAHRVESPDTSASNNGVVDGVKLDKFQRPLGYFIGEGDEYPRRHREVKADAMLHVYEPERADQVRGYPAIGVALNSVLDRDELLRFEMMAAKAGSSIGLVIKNSTGNIGAEGFLGDFSKDSNGNLTRESIFGGGLVPRMKNTEDIQSFVMNRPNEKLDKHLEQYIRAAAIGLGLPYEFVWDTSAIGGVAQRFIIQKAARCFAARQDVLVNAFLSKLWRYAIARAISRKELPMNPGWQSVGWQTPRSITVDVGREATARRDDVKAGLMTLSDYFGEQGIDWKEAVAEIATEREFAADLGVMIGVEQAQPQDQILPAAVEPEVVMPAAEFSQLIAKLDCGTGAGGFKPGNDCASGGASGKKKDEPKGEKSGHPAPHKHQAITDFEERVKSQDFESILILDGSGNVLVQKDGDERSVDFDFGALDQADGVVDGKIQIPGLVASHNHPTSKSFSSPDWIAAKQIDAAEFRVTSSKYVYVLKRPEKGWPALSTLRKTVNEEKRVSFDKFETLYKQGKITVEEANFEYTHEWNSNVAAWIGAKYERIKR
jgi:lambda family phage portal protein